MTRKFATAPIAVLVLSAAGAVFAAEGRIPIWTTGAINASGKYVVTRNITATAAGAMIDVMVDNVDIDLNGFTLDHGGFNGPCVNATGVARVTVRNGKLIGGTDSVSTTNASQVVVEDLKIVGSQGAGIRLDTTTEFHVRRNQIVGAIGDGIFVPSPGTLVTGTIEENEVQNSLTGVHVQFGSGVAILHNRMLSTAVVGLLTGTIWLENGMGCLVSENTMDDAGGNGILLYNTRKSKLYDNVISFPKNNGIYLNFNSFGNLILNNVVGAAVQCGILIDGSQNLLDRNTLTNNTGIGLKFSAGATGNGYGRNLARNNGLAVPCAGGGNPPLFFPNSCNENPLAGLGVQNSTFGDNLIPGPPIF